MNEYYVPFTREMKEKGYTILIPSMLPFHFKMIEQVMNSFGYQVRLMKNDGPHIVELGLKYVHNDACYPALLVIGQYLDMLENSGLDPHKTALMMFQTGGGCRASNYMSLIRRALARAGYEYVPVIALSFAGIEKHPGWKLTLPMTLRLLHCLLYGDMLMDLYNQTRSYELEPGSALKLAEQWTIRLSEEMKHGRNLAGAHIRGNYRRMVKDFSSLPMNRTEKPRVGIVGEIYIKYSALGNNRLEEFLVQEGAEVVVPGVLDFFLYSLTDRLEDYKLYGLGRGRILFYQMAFKLFNRKKNQMLRCIRESGIFRTSSPFTHTIELAREYISLGVKMGEGWLLTAEMLELAESGVNNIVCAQPFGCLPNHICGKGMMKPLKEKNPHINIVAVDYDPGASEVNQLNRIKLMLSNAKA